MIKTKKYRQKSISALKSHRISWQLQKLINKFNKFKPCNSENNFLIIGGMKDISIKVEDDGFQKTLPEIKYV